MITRSRTVRITSLLSDSSQSGICCTDPPQLRCAKVRHSTALQRNRNWGKALPCRTGVGRERATTIDEDADDLTLLLSLFGIRKIKPRLKADPSAYMPFPCTLPEMCARPRDASASPVFWSAGDS